MNHKNTDEEPGPLSILREPKTNKLSSSRILLLSWGIVVLIIWSVISLINHELAPLDESVVTVIGILVGGKAVQRFGENQ
jgi:hypothetical protein